jgi:phospholipase/carboxylesterase
MKNEHESVLSNIEIAPSMPVTHSIIWLHGLGADANDFTPIVPDISLSHDAKLRFIFPNAPVQPVTINAGYQMRAWFDIYGLETHSPIDRPGIEQSMRAIEKLIEREVSRGIATSNIFLAGFSQGAVIALMTGLGYLKPLAGMIVLSGYLPLSDEVIAKSSYANKNTPIFIAHGTEDMVVPYAFGETTHAILSQEGYPTTWHSYTMPHTVCSEEIKHLSQWLSDQTNKKKALDK